MTISTIYLISGANRGIGSVDRSSCYVYTALTDSHLLLYAYVGFALVSHILAKSSDKVVYAGCRDPENATVLKQLEETYTGRIYIVKLVSADISGNNAVAKQIGEKYGRVDTVIANAGVLQVVLYIFIYSAELMCRGWKSNFQ